jgi:hypothetical protein
VHRAPIIGPPFGEIQAVAGHHRRQRGLRIDKDARVHYRAGLPLAGKESRDIGAVAGQ